MEIGKGSVSMYVCERWRLGRDQLVQHATNVYIRIYEYYQGQDGKLKKWDNSLYEPCRER